MSGQVKDRYARLAGRFWRHPKAVASSDAALALWVRALSYVVDQLTDGHVSRAVAESLSKGKPEKAAAELVKRGLWEPHPTDGWMFHDYPEHNITAVGWAEEKARKAKNQSDKRARDAATARPVTANVTGDDSGDITGHPQTQDARRKTQDAGLSERDLRSEAHARVDLDLPPDLPTEPALGAVLSGFRSRWQAKHSDAWMGPLKHRALADTVARSIDSGQLTRERLAASLDGFFASTDAFVIETRHRFVTWATDPGRWISARSEPETSAAAALARLDVKSLGPLAPDEQRSVADDFGFNDPAPAKRTKP